LIRSAVSKIAVIRDGAAGSVHRHRRAGDIIQCYFAAARADFESGPFTVAEKLGFRAAERLHHSAAEIDDAFFAELKQNFTDPQIIELIATAAAFELFPRFVDALRIPITPNPSNV